MSFRAASGIIHVNMNWEDWSSAAPEITYTKPVQSSYGFWKSLALRGCGTAESCKERDAEESCGSPSSRSTLQPPSICAGTESKRLGAGDCGSERGSE